MGNTSRLDLHGALSKRTFHHAVICTYTFDPLFFEEYCLERFASLANNNNISVLTDRSTYQEILAAPDSQRPKHLNLRYLLHPIDVKGRFHPKIFLLTTKTSGRLIIGSANFTHAGLTSNAELASVFDFEIGESEYTLPIFRDTFALICSIARRWPSGSLNSNIQELLRSTPWLNKEGASDPSISLIHNLDKSLWDQISALITEKVDRVHIVSRFFDESPALIDRVFRDWSPQQLCIYTQNGLTTMTSKWLENAWVRAGRAEILLCTYEDDGHRQPLHAKAFIVERRSGATVLYGSANFTSAALLSSGASGNVELLIAIPNQPTGSVSPELLCDPIGSAVHLGSPDQLQSAERDKRLEYKAMPIHLAEAVLDGDSLVLTATMPVGYTTDAMTARLRVQDSRGQLLPVVRLSDSSLVATVPANTLPRLQESSSVIGLERLRDNEQLSNLVFVTNLLDIKTQKALRPERRIYEAMQSAAQFYAVLNDLMRAGDDAALLVFLNTCDIPFVNGPRPPALRGRPVWEGREGMRTLGAKNLLICKTMHGATLKFFERHFRKLTRHADSLLLDGLPNFLHIFLSMGGLLRMQIERAIIALNHQARGASPQQWGECRELWDVYFLKFKDLMECLWDRYMKPLAGQYSSQELEQEFGEDLQSVREICDEMIQYRAQIEQLRKTKCIHRRTDGRQILLPYYRSILAPDRWHRYAEVVKRQESSVEMAVLGNGGDSPSDAKRNQPTA